VLTLALVAGLLTSLQRAPGEAHPDVPQQRVDEAIARGVKFLATAPSPDADKGIKDSDELVLLTLIHAGVPESDPKLQALLKNVLGKNLERTYPVSLLAMCLEELDRARHQPKLFQCAQFLIDNMMENGRWSYGTPSEFASTATVPPAPSSGKPRKLPVRKLKTQPGQGGDNSNSQYAALGLRACHEAGIVFPRDAVEKARKSWLDCEHPAEGDAPRKAAAGSGRSTVVMGQPRGWCYAKGGGKCEYGGAPYASMTAGAAGAICIYDYMLGRDWKGDPAVADGLAWLDKNWTVGENFGGSETGGPGKGAKTWHLYSLYALERLGMLYHTTHVGTHDWYKEGALFLLDAQAANGSWKLSHSMNPTWDTCFAILFLKRATRPMVASTDRFQSK